MTKLIPNEIAQKIPGVTITNPLMPFISETVTETVNLEGASEYAVTPDKLFVQGKEYYIEDGFNRFEPKFRKATAEDGIVVGATIPFSTFYEKHNKETISGSAESTYMCYTNGMWVDNDPKYGYKLREHAIEIIRTSVITSGASKYTINEHAYGVWSKRKSLTYVPIFQRLESDDYNESARMFR